MTSLIDPATLNRATQSKLLVACSYLFPKTGALQQNFLKTLTPEMLKIAYRQSVKDAHPDRHASEGAERLRFWNEHFKKTTDAYDLLLSFINGTLPIEPQNLGKIIAVGGAKGGIGKTVFSANLGVFLHNRGYRVILVDLDLGGANLSLYLGEKYLLEKTINDFLLKKYARLDDILLPSRRGPSIIGGDSSQLGSTNIPFAQKLKLLRAIRRLDADFIILDLGGDTSYNILDFFLLGDYGIVMTTKEPAAYIGAYQFIKTALYRKLNRLAGPESKFDAIEDKGLANLLQESTLAASGASVQSIEELLGRIKIHDPLQSPLLVKALLDFAPFLVVNRVDSPAAGAMVAKTIQALVRKHLSIELAFPGSLGDYPGVNEKMTDRGGHFPADLSQRFDREMQVLVQAIFQNTLSFHS